MDSDIKNGISHRGKALEKLKEFFSNSVNGTSGNGEEGEPAAKVTKT